MVWVRKPHKSLESTISLELSSAHPANSPVTSTGKLRHRRERKQGRSCAKKSSSSQGRAVHPFAAFYFNINSFFEEQGQHRTAGCTNPQHSSVLEKKNKIKGLHPKQAGAEVQRVADNSLL